MTETNDEALGEAIAEASLQFDQMCQDRHNRGAEKYGPLKFLGANTLEEALEELVDLANYARYTFIKIWFLNQQLDQVVVPDTEIGKIISNKPKLHGEE